MHEIPDVLLQLPSAGQNLRGATLGAHLGERPTVIAFLRHFG